MSLFKQRLETCPKCNKERWMLLGKTICHICGMKI